MSLKSRLLAAFAAVSLVAAACASQKPAQTEASSSVEEMPNEGPAAPATQLTRIEAPEGFVVRMPGQPEAQRNKVTIPAGDVTTAAWSINVDGVLYSVSIADYPEKVVASSPAEAFLKDAQQGLVNQLKGTLKNEEALTINSVYPGKAYTVSSDNGEVRARNYLVGPRLYTLLVLFNPSIGAPAADEFLGSLELINPPPVVERASKGGADGGTLGDGGMGEPGMDAGTPAGTPDAGTATGGKRRTK